MSLATSVTTTVKEAVGLLEAGQGPVQVTASLARKLAAEHPDLLDGRLKLLRLAALGPGPYAPGAYERYELVIRPDAEPMSSAERKARGQFDKQLGEALAAEELASAVYEAAERNYFEAAGRALAAGSSEWGVAPGQPLQPARFNLGGQPLQPNDEFKAARAAETETRAAWQEAGDVLQKRRRALNKVESRIDWAARLARS